MIPHDTPPGTAVLVRLANDTERSTKTQCEPYRVVARDHAWYVRAHGLHGGYPIDRVRLDEGTEMKPADPRDEALRRGLATSAQDVLGIAAAILDREAGRGWEDVPSRVVWIRNALGRATRGDAGPARAAHEALSRAALGSVRATADVEAFLAARSLGAVVALMRGAK